MDVREKLVELLAGCPCESDCEGMVGSCPHRKNGNCNEIFKLSYCAVSKLAQHLIAHGVTVQDEAKLYWKPVKHGEWNLTCSACDSHLGCRKDAKYCPECGAKFIYPKAVMPQPPKGE